MRLLSTREKLKPATGYACPNCGGAVAFVPRSTTSLVGVKCLQDHCTWTWRMSDAAKRVRVLAIKAAEAGDWRRFDARLRAYHYLLYRDAITPSTPRPCP